MREHFLLEPGVTFLNHGSFGATPKPVLAARERWLQQMERQPVRFMQHELLPALYEARLRLAAWLGADVLDTVFVANATVAANIAARSLVAALAPGDEVLTTDHEYGACNNAWIVACAQRGVHYRKQPLPLPLGSDEAIVAQLWAGVTPQTRVIYLSHITSPTAVTLPVAQIAAKARAAGILTVVDGAHAPGQLPLHLEEMGADIYFGNLHKWLCAPKGAAFLHVRRELQPQMQPLVVSWGYGPERNMFEESDFISMLQWQGTNDFSSFLAVPAALDFWAGLDEAALKQRCHRLLAETVGRITAVTGLPSSYPSDHAYAQLAIVPIPRQPDLPAFKAAFCTAHHIEIPATSYGDQQFLRISVQIYNSAEDLGRLVEAVAGMR
jgi:isopenicillin-N epimerase